MKPAATAITAPKQAPMTLKSFFDLPEVRQKLADAAGGVFKPEDMIRLALIQGSRNPDILKCTQASVLRCLMEAALMRVEPTGVNGRGYIVPRKNNKTDKLEASFDPGWRGLVDIARRSGQIATIDAHAVYKGDVFHVRLGLNQDLVHEPTLDPAARGELIAAYAIAVFKDSNKQFELLMRADIDKIRATSAAQNGPWKTWLEEMARKSSVRRLCKYLPYEPELERAIAASYEADAEPEESAQPRAQSLAARIRENVLSEKTEPAPAAEEHVVTADGEVVS